MTQSDSAVKSPKRSAAKHIDEKIKGLGDWRGERLAQIRNCIRLADPDVVEEVKWVKASNPAGVPVWSDHGIICTGETYKDKIKLTFARGASLKDPAKLFNASLQAGTRRAIDIHEDDEFDDTAFKELIKATVFFNRSESQS